MNFIVKNMPDIDYDEEFDSVTLFSCINYLTEDGDLEKLFIKVYNALRR